MKKVKLFCILIIIVASSACSGSGGKNINYFARAGLVSPKFEGQELNEHLKSFETLFNDLGTAAARKELNKRDELNIAYSNWYVKAKQFGPKLSREEGQRLLDYLGRTKTAWNTYYSDLFKI